MTTTMMAREMTEKELFCLSIRELWIKKQWGLLLGMLQNHYQHITVLERMAKINRFCALFDRYEDTCTDEIVDWIISGSITNIRACITHQLVVSTQDKLIFLSDFSISTAPDSWFSFRVDCIYHNQERDEYLVSEGLMPEGSRVYFRHASKISLNVKDCLALNESRLKEKGRGVFSDMQTEHFNLCFDVITSKIRMAEENTKAKNRYWNFSEGDQAVG